VFSLTYFCLLCNLGSIIIFPPISLLVLKKILQELFGDDRKSTSGEDRFDLATHARFIFVSFPLKHVFIVFFFLFFF
jgi:hypothetical protein